MVNEQMAPDCGPRVNIYRSEPAANVIDQAGEEEQLRLYGDRIIPALKELRPAAIA